MGKKLTIEYAKQFFDEQGCELLEKEYVNVKTKMRYICNCGNISYISFNSFQQGQRCKECGYKKSAEKFKFTFEFVDRCFEDNGCKLLETEYVNCMTKMRYRCSCGNESEICFSNFQQGQRCMECGVEKRAKKKRHTYEYVFNCFEEHGCILLEKEYIDANTKMRYICICGEESNIRFSSFQRGHRCKICGHKKNAEKQMYTFEFVDRCFKDEGCELLETEYIGALVLMRYICSCKNESKICFGSFRQGQRCIKCGIEKSAKQKRHTFEFVEQCFKDGGCILLETGYINSLTKMRYRCSCGNESKICFNKFKQGQRCNKCADRGGYRGGYSKESQKLFDAIYEKLNKKQKDKTYYATLNKEFGINYRSKKFYYDYVNSKSKKAIEYNGSAFHPIFTLKNSDISWFAFDKTKTAGEARAYEKIKYEGLEKRGYQILTVWDYEAKKQQDFDTLVQKCLDFLTT